MAKTKVHLEDTNLPVESGTGVKFVVSKNGKYELQTFPLNSDTTEVMITSKNSSYFTRGVDFNSSSTDKMVVSRLDRFYLEDMPIIPDCCDDVEKLMATWGFYIDTTQDGQAFLDWCDFFMNFIAFLSERVSSGACGAHLKNYWKNFIQFVYGRERTSGGVDTESSLIADLIGWLNVGQFSSEWINYDAKTVGGFTHEKSVFKKIFELILAETHTEFNTDFKAAIVKLLGCDPCARVSDVEDDVDALMETWGLYMTAPSGSVPDWTIAWCSFLADFIAQLKDNHVPCGVTTDWKDFIQEIYGRERTSGSVTAANSLIADLIGQLQAGTWNNYEEKFDGSVRISEKSVFKKIFELISAETHTDFNADFKAAIIKLLGCDPCQTIESNIEPQLGQITNDVREIELRVAILESQVGGGR